MLENAMSENAVDLLLEMYEAVETGRLRSIELCSANDHAHHAGRVCPGDNPAADGRAGNQLAWDRPLAVGVVSNVAGTPGVPARKGMKGLYFELVVRTADFQNWGVPRLPKLVNRVAVFRKCCT